MRRLVLAAVIIASALAVGPSAGQAQVRQLWPGVTYESGVQFTLHGPVAINILRGPRPGGATTLAPVLSNESLLGTETLTAMQRRLASTATLAGVNGDYFSLGTGRPSGVLMQDGQLLSPPRGSRVSAGITTDGTLDIQRVSFFGAWQGAGARHPFNWFNQPPGEGEVAVFTDAYGPTTPAVPGAAAAVLFTFPTAVPDIDLAAPIVEVVEHAGVVPIPPGGAVVLATGSSATTLLAEAAPGASLTVALGLRPDWSGVVEAIGGGPLLVRDGAPVFAANEAFTRTQLVPRAPRTGIGQRRDGSIVLVAVDGRQPGYSTGLTNFELAQALVRLGAVTAMAFDGGGSTTMAFDGTLLNRPSGGRERRIASALMFAYTGVFLSEAPAVVSPNGDGVADAVSLSYRVVRQSSVSTELTAPDGSVTPTPAEPREPGTYPIVLPTLDPTKLGSWKVVVRATDDLGQATEMSRTFRVDDTLGALRVRAALAVPPGGAELPIAWTLAREALVTVTVRDARGTLVRSLLRRRLPAGEQQVTWNGLDRPGKPVAAGRYTVHVTAVGALGSSELEAGVRVRRVSS